MNNKDAKKAGIGYVIGNYLLKGLSFLTIPIYSRLMQTSDYGIYNTFGAYESIFYIVLGFAIHTSYKNARYKYGFESENGVGGKNYDSYVSASMILILVSTLVWGIISSVFSDGFSSLLGLDNFSVLLLLLYSMGSAIIACYNAYVGLEYEYKSFVKIAGLNAILNTMLSVILMLTCFSEQRYMGRILGTTLPTLIIIVYVLHYFFKKSRPGNCKEYWSWGLNYSVPLIPHGISQVVLSQFDRIMISRMISSATSGIYSFAYNIYNIINVTARALDNVWNPWFYERMHSEDYVTIKKKSSNYLILMFLISSGVILISPELVKILGSKEYWDAIYCVIPIVAGGFFSFMYTIPASVEYYYEKTKYIAVATCVAAIINIVLNYVFILRFGYVAAAYTTLVTYIIYFVFHYFMAWKIHGNFLFSNKCIIVCSAAILMVSFVSSICIEYIPIRIALAVIDGIAFVIYEEKNFGILSKYLKRNR